VRTAITIFVAAALLISPPFWTPTLAATTATTTARDGQKDFEFLIGTWRTRYKRLRHPLSKSHDWYGCEGTSVVRQFWNGGANIEDGDLRCPHEYIGGMTLRLYSTTSHQWSLYWGTKKRGLAMPPQVGHFDANGVGEFFADDTFAGKPIVVRYKWTRLSGDHPHFDQAFSADGGRTWETNWSTDYTRTPLAVKSVRST
jgi:hypothetical protein